MFSQPECNRDFRKFFNWRRGLIIAATSILLTISQCALALKVETHIWIAQDIVNEIEASPTISFLDKNGGKVGTIAIPDRVRIAILKNREMFLLGSMGPDAFPGIYEGQMTIHPGSEHRGWGADNWLNHLLRTAKSEDELAFAYGAMTHGAVDIFAHTYVNTYSGDSWELKDGEADVELRHFLMEGYIASKMPHLKDNNGHSMRPPSQLILKNGEIPVPTSLLFRAYIEDSGATEQMASNGSPHFRQVAKLRTNLQDLAKPGGTLQRLHELSQKILIYCYTKQEINSRELQRLNDAHQKVRNAVNEGIDKVQQAHDGFRSHILVALNNSARVDVESQTAALNGAINAYKAIRDLENEKRRIEDDIAKILDDLNPVLGKEKECKRICGLPLCDRDWFGIYHPIGCRDAQDACRSACTELSRITLEEALRAKRRVEDEIDKSISRTKENYLEAMAKSYDFARKVYLAEGQLINLSINYAQRTANSVDPVKSMVLGWVADIETAMGGYYLANGAAIRNTMIGEDPLAPLIRWKDCIFPLILGVPSEIADGACTIKDVALSLKELIDRLEYLAGQSLPVVGEILDLKRDLESALKASASEELINFGSKVTGTDIQSLLDVIKERPTAETLNTQFSKAPASKKLLTFMDAAQRLDSDMGIRSGAESQTLNVDGFALIYNARVLARLVLLDADSINTLFGQRLVDPKDKNSSIMDKFAHSIDGNHQWMQLAPPHARSGGQKHACGDSNGYQDFVLWEPESRRSIFRRMFKGPLAPAIEIPYESGFSAVRPTDYPFVTSKEHPYPNWTINFDRCTKE